MAAQMAFIRNIQMFNLIHQRNQFEGDERDFIEKLTNAPNELRTLIHFLATYVYISQNPDNVKLIFCKEIKIESVVYLLNHPASNIRRNILWLLVNIYYDLPNISSEKYVQIRSLCGRIINTIII